MDFAVLYRNASALARVAIQCAAAKGADSFCVDSAADFGSFLVSQIAGLRPRQHSCFIFHDFLLQDKLGPFLAPKQLALPWIAVEKRSAQNGTHGGSTDGSSRY